MGGRFQWNTYFVSLIFISKPLLKIGKLKNVNVITKNIFMANVNTKRLKDGVKIVRQTRVEGRGLGEEKLN